MNTFFAAGRVVNEPKLEITPNGKKKLTFQFITDSRIKEGDKKLSFSIPAVIWGEPAQWLYDSLSKGSPIALQGDLGTSKYTDKQGEIKYYTYLLIDQFTYGESPEMAAMRKGRNKQEEYNGLDVPVSRGGNEEEYMN